MMQRLKSFFLDVRAFFKIIGLMLYDDILVKEYDWKERAATDTTYKYSIGNDVVEEIIDNNVNSHLSKLGFQKLYSDMEGFSIATKTLKFQFVEQRFDGIELRVIALDSNEKIDLAEWNKLFNTNLPRIQHIAEEAHTEMILRQLNRYCEFIRTNKMSFNSLNNLVIYERHINTLKKSAVN